MGITEWTIIGTAIGLLVVLIPVIKLVNSASTNELKAIIADNRAESKGEIAEVRTEIAVVRTEIVELRSELKSDTAGLRSELKSDIAELKGDMAELRAELKGDMAELRAELKGDMAELRNELKLDFQANRAEIITNRRMLGRFALHRHGDDGLPLAPLTDALEPLDGNDPADNENGSD